MESSPGIVRRRIQEMSSNFNLQQQVNTTTSLKPSHSNVSNVSQRGKLEPPSARSPMSSPRLTARKFGGSTVPTATAAATEESSSTSNMLNSSARPFRKLHDNLMTSASSKENLGNANNSNNRHHNHPHPFSHSPDLNAKIRLFDSNGTSAKVTTTTTHFQGFHLPDSATQKRTPPNLMAPQPFKMQYSDCQPVAVEQPDVQTGNHHHHIQYLQSEDSSNNDPPPPILPKRSGASMGNLSKPAVPPKPKHFKDACSPSSEDESSSSSSSMSVQKNPLVVKPVVTSPRRTTSPAQTIKNNSCNLLNMSPTTTMSMVQECDDGSDKLSPLPQILKRTKSSPPLNFVEIDQDDIQDKVMMTKESPLNTSFTKFNLRVQKLDLLKRRQSYSEFEELIEREGELRERMMSKIQLLREERDVLLAEKLENDEVGLRIKHRLENLAAPSEVEKYRQFLEEIEQITKLTVGLTIRLSRLSRRIENGSSQFSTDTMRLEENKRQRLVEQTKEAEFLHRNTDRRSIQVRKMLSRYLDEVGLHEYDSFLNNLIKHITDLKETEQRIQLGEEQLVALNDNLVSDSGSSSNNSPSPANISSISCSSPL